MSEQELTNGKRGAQEELGASGLRWLPTPDLRVSLQNRKCRPNCICRMSVASEKIMPGSEPSI
jgi:hypothetical protein